MGARGLRWYLTDLTYTLMHSITLIHSLWLLATMVGWEFNSFVHLLIFRGAAGATNVWLILDGGTNAVGVDGVTGTVVMVSMTWWLFIDGGIIFVGLFCIRARYEPTTNDVSKHSNLPKWNTSTTRRSSSTFICHDRYSSFRWILKQKIAKKY